MNGKDKKMYTKLWSENLKGRDHMDNQGIHGGVILSHRIYLKERMRECELDL
jgi:hypothetical protein